MASSKKVPLGIGITRFTYYQSDGKVVNLYDPTSIGLPARTVPGITWDEYGWPTYLPPGVSSGWYLPATEGYTKPGRYRLAAMGTGKLCIKHPDIPSANQTISVKSPGSGLYSVVGEWDIKTTARVLTGILETDPADPLRQLKFHRVENNPDDFFTREYLQGLALFDTLRVGYTEPINSPDVDWPANPDDPFGRPAKWLAGIEAANKAGSDLWLMIPHKATEGYVRELAKLVKAHLRPGIKVYLEYSIEIWNWSYPFGPATKWVDDWTKANVQPISPGGAVPFTFGYAELARRMHETFASEAPDVPIVRLLCSQHGNPNLGEQCVRYSTRIKGWKIDAIGTAPYMEARGLDWATLDSLWAGDEASKERAIGLVFEGFERGLAGLDANARKYRALADQNQIRLVTYEVGPDMTVPSPTPKRQELFLAAHRHPKMYAMLTERYFPWIAQYFDLIMYTQDCDRVSTGKFWAAKANVDDNDCPKWRACVDWCLTGRSNP